METPAHSLSGFQQSLINMKHSFLGGKIDFEFGFSVVFVEEH